MLRVSHWFVALAAVAGLLQIAAWAADDKQMVNNPPYTHWSAFKPGTTVTQRERVLFAKGSDEADYYAGARVNDSTYKLLEVMPKHVVVQMTIFEHGPGSVTEHAPVKITFPATAEKAQVLGGREEIEKFTEGEEEVKVIDKTVKAHFVDIVDIDGDETVERKIWESNEIPGGIVKEVKKTKKGKKVVAETIIQVLGFHVEK
ncbi:MAG: hypothetical protein WBX00_13775 [Isosphaeraceae bacterium]